MSARNYKTVSHSKIIEYLEANRDRMVKVQDIDNYLKDTGIEVNNSTIYRYLNKLSNDGVIMKYVANKGEMSSFQYVGDSGHNCRENL